MDQEKYLILINGQDRTDSVAHFQLESEYCEIIYTKSRACFKTIKVTKPKYRQVKQRHENRQPSFHTG